MQCTHTLTTDNSNGKMHIYQWFERKMKMIDYMKEFKIKNVLNYLRRSRQDVQREKQTGEDTLAAQRKLMKGVLEGYAVPYVQKMEIGSGDKISTRPVFQEVLEDLKMEKYDAIAVKEISRLGRGSYKDMGVIFDLLVDKRIFVITPYRIYDPANNADLRQIRFELFMAREEFETTRERLTGARYNAAFEGKWMGQVPFGYERSKKSMKLIPVKEEADVVKLIFDLYINGYEGKQVRERAIGTILKRLGIKTAKGKKDWDTTQLKRILTNDVYIGVSKFRTTKKNSEGKVEKRPEHEHIIREEAHPMIISKSHFDEVQNIMKNVKCPKTRFDVDNYELTGLLTCKHCGRKTVVNRYKRKRLSEDYYDMYVKCRNGCFTVKYHFAEENLISILNHLKDADEKVIFDLYSQSINKEDEKQRENFLEQIQESANKKKAELKNRLRFIADKHFEKIYTDEDYLRYKREIDIELDEVEKMLNGNVNETAAAKEEIDFLEIQNNFINLLEAYKKSADAMAKNDLLRSIFESVNIEILEKGTKKQEPKIKFEITLSNNFWKN